MSYVRASTANPTGFRPWQSRLSGLGVTASGDPGPDMQPSPTWGGAFTQLQTEAGSIYQNLQKPIAVPVFGNVPLLYVAGGALTLLAFFFVGGKRR